MGCGAGMTNAKVQRSTAIEIIDEAEYKNNPKCAKYVNLSSNGVKIKLHYRELNSFKNTLSRRKN